MYSREKTIALAAKTADATSEAIDILGAKKVLIEFIEGGTVLNRAAALSVTGAVEAGGTHVTLNTLVDNVVNDNTKTYPAHVASKSRSSAGRDILALDLSFFPVEEIKIVLDVTDGETPTGNFTVNVIVEK